VEREKFKVGDFVVHDCTMPYPNTVYRVEELDERGNFRGPAVFRLTADAKAYPTRKGQWFGWSCFRVLSKEELKLLVEKLSSLVA
jgi:hypothetical protein